MSLNGSTNEEKIWNYLKAKGLPDCGIAGLMGNLYAESCLIPTNLQNSYEKSLGFTDAAYTAAVDKGTYQNFVKDSAGYGLAQWTYWSRKKNLLDFAKKKGKSIGDLEMQLDFLWNELQGYKVVISALKTAKTVRAASDSVLVNFERPADQSEAAKARRAGFGQKFYDKYAADSTAQKGVSGVSKCYASAVVAVAIGELGYVEKASNSQLDNKTANPGSANWTKYARDFDEKYPKWYNGKKNGYEWCDMFVDWCFVTAFGYENALRLLCQPERSCGAGCTWSAKYYKQKGQFHTSNPKMGDQIFFGTSIDNCTHTGLVEKVDASKVYPDIGAPNWEIIVAAAAEQIAGAGLILWTCREGKLLENALEACARWGLHFDAVNDSLPSWKKFYGDDTRKVGATEYWDDKAYRVQNGKLMKEAAHEMV